jgi:hypothetical protein
MGELLVRVSQVELRLLLVLEVLEAPELRLMVED